MRVGPHAALNNGCTPPFSLAARRMTKTFKSPLKKAAVVQLRSVLAATGGGAHAALAWARAITTAKRVKGQGHNYGKEGQVCDPFLVFLDFSWIAGVRTITTAKRVKCVTLSLFSSISPLLACLKITCSAQMQRSPGTGKLFADMQ
eukprot:1161532-Pelagomonas_calceolata.AAC.2